MTLTNRCLIAGVSLATLLYGGSPAWAQATAPSLGAAAPYTVLGTNGIPTAATVTCTGSTINGSVGSTFTSITNTGCTITGSTDTPVAGSVVTDFNAAFTAIDTLNPICDGVIPTTTTTLAPGVYCSVAGTTIGAGVTLTLAGTATDVWIFRVGTGGAGALTLTGASVVMSGTAQACNSYWKTSAGSTMTDATFNGTILSGAAVTMTRGSWTGRALATTDATVTGPASLTFAGCSPPVRPTVAKAFSPASIAPGGVSTLTITLNNPNASDINLNTLFTDTLPGIVRVAAVPNVATTCGGGPASAVAGGTTVTLANGSTIPSGSCTITVDVTAAAAGSYTNTISAGDLKTNTGNNAAPATATLTATCPTITVGPATVPPGRVAVPYSQQLTASGGTGPYVYTVSGGALPAGLTLSSGGLISGTPTTLGSTPVTIRATDGNGCSGTLAYTIVIAAAACPAITVGPATVPPGRVAVAYSQQLTASGGTGPYVYTVLSGALPAGLTLSSGGLIAGMPTTLGSSTVTIQATDGSGCPGVIAYTVVIAAAACPVITVGPATVPPGRMAVAYSQQLTASGGTGPYVYTVLSGALPAGLTLSSGGLIAGTPTTLGSTPVTIQAADGSGCPGVIAHTIVIAAATCPVVTVGPATLPAGTVAVAYSRQLTASGGTGPYVFTVLSGALPDGLSLSSGGLLSGTPTTLGSTLVTIQANDGSGCPGVIAYTIAVASGVPTLPLVFVVLLVLGLTGAGRFRLRRWARAE